MSSMSPANVPERHLSHTEDVAISGQVSIELEKILGSSAFEGSESLKRFLRYAVEHTLHGEGGQLKEYRLGVEVFQRTSAFDPRLDPVVRMAARRLRIKLQEYYGDEGRGDPIRIDVPKGSYSATFTSHGHEHDDPPGPRLIAEVGPALAQTTTDRHHLHSGLSQVVVSIFRGASSRWVWASSGMVVFLIVLLASREIRFSLSHSNLTRGETGKLLIADVANGTGEAVFDDTLKQAIAADLSQSPFLDIVSDARIRATLKLMSSSMDTRITPEVAREVCQRSGSTTYISGSIQSLGREYVIGLNAVNCQTGDLLAQEQATAENKEHVLRAMDDALRKIRQRLGESLSTIQKFDVPLDQATTPSLEALKAYSLGNQARDRRGDAAAVYFFKHAIELDPDFAMAYDALGLSYSNMDEPGRASENILQAYTKRDRASERERFEIAADYSQMVTGELDKVNEVCEEWAQAYPRDAYPHDLLGVNYEFVGKYEDAIAQILEAIRLNPDGVVLRSNLMEAQMALNRLGDAKATYRDALARNLDHPYLHADRYGIAFLEGDKAEMASQLSWASGQPGGEDFLLSLESNTSASAGLFRKARELSKRAIESAIQRGQKETAALWKMNSALREAEFGNLKLAQQETEAALSLASTRDVRILAALTMARAKNPSRAQDIADNLAAQFPLNVVINRYWLPTIRASIEVDRGNPQKAIDILSVAAPYELGYPDPQIDVGGLRYPAFVRGQAYLSLKQGSAAVSEFRKIADTGSLVGNFPLGSLARLDLARAYTLSGNSPQSADSYRQFFTLWKAADSDVPLLKQAQVEYSKVR